MASCPGMRPCKHKFNWLSVYPICSWHPVTLLRCKTPRPVHNAHISAVSHTCCSGIYPGPPLPNPNSVRCQMVFWWWEDLHCFNNFQVDDVTVGLMVQQFLDEWHFRVLHSGLAYAWDRPEATKRHQHVLFPCFESQYQDAQAWGVDRELNMIKNV